ncbi:hypothetical protein Csa_021463, partial [Cucumis sativus]
TYASHSFPPQASYAAENSHRLTHKQCFNWKCYVYDEIHLCSCSSWPKEVLSQKFNFISNQSSTGTTQLRFWQ